MARPTAIINNVKIARQNAFKVHFSHAKKDANISSISILVLEKNGQRQLCQERNECRSYNERNKHRSSQFIDNLHIVYTFSNQLLEITYKV